MAQSLIQKLLDVGLFDIGDEDERLGYFQKAAADFAKVLSETPAKLIPAVLTAIDPAVPVEEPVLEAAESAVKTHWKSFSNKYPQRPRELLRPVVLEALGLCADEDVSAATIIWLAGSSLFARIEQTKDGGIIREFLQQCGEKAEASAIKEWELSETKYTAPTLAFKITSPKRPAIDRTAFSQQLQQHPNHYGGLTHNISGPIASVIEENTGPVYDYAAGLTEQIKGPTEKYARDVSAMFTRWTENAVARFGLRTDLLWWRQSLYSPTLRRSYRGLSPAATAISLAEDLDRICTRLAPQSVEYFLRETVNDSLREDLTVSLKDLLEAAKTDHSLDLLLAGEQLAPPPQRTCLLAALRAGKNSPIDVKSCRAWLGLPVNFKLPTTEWAVWLFRDAQALAVTASNNQ